MKETAIVLLLLLVSSPLKAQWKTLQTGLDYQRINLPSSNNSDQPHPIHLFRIDLSRYRIDLLTSSAYGRGLSTAHDYRHSSRALLVINGGFFDEANRPLGLLVSRGKMINPLRNSEWGIFFLGGKKGNAPSIIHRKVWTPENVTLAIQVGPRLLIDGEIPRLKESLPSRRSAIGITKEGAIVIGLSEALIGLKEWAKLLQKECLQALNLDGGGSSQIVVGLENFSLNVSGMTGVPNALAVFPSDRY